MKPLLCGYFGHDAALTIYHPEREKFYVLQMDRFANVKHFHAFGHWEPDHPHPKWTFNNLDDPELARYKPLSKGRGCSSIYAEDFFMIMHQTIKELWDIDNDYSYFIHKHRSNVRKPDVWNWMISHPNTFKWEKQVYAGNYRFKEPLRDMPTKFTRWKHTHHDWHTFNGFYQSPFDRAVVFSMDGGGDDTQCQWCVIDENFNIVEKDVYREIMAGVTYTYLGTKCTTFNKTTAAIIDLPGKMMGFSAYAPRNCYTNELAENILRHGMNFWPSKRKDKYHSDIDDKPAITGMNTMETFDEVNNAVRMRRDSKYIGVMDWFGKHYGRTGPDLRRNGFWGKDEADICSATQQALEKVYYYMIKDVLMPKIKKNGNNLVLTGGCSLNVLAVQMIQREFPDINVHVSRDPEDGGLSFGGMIDFMAANDMVPKRNLPIETPRLLDYDIVPDFIEEYGAVETDLKEVATLLKEGNIMGFVQGNVERGPRALGFRSILCDPVFPEQKARINAKVKRREPYRPFAPACRAEDAEKYFLIDKNDSVLETMSTVVVVREEERVNLSAITHFDGTARLQTVTPTSNPMFYDLLTEFGGVLLNTSFNLQGCPILNRAEHALEMLYNTDLDYVIIEHDGKLWKFK